MLIQYRTLYQIHPNFFFIEKNRLAVPLHAGHMLGYLQNGKVCRMYLSFLSFRFLHLVALLLIQALFLPVLFVILTFYLFPAETLTCKGMWTGPAETQFQPFQNDEEDSNEYIVDDDSNDDPPAKTVNYLVGILDEPFLTRVNDKVKCFIYQETAKGGYRLAQSADASCRGLVNVRKDGYRTLHLKPCKSFTFFSKKRGPY